MHVAQITAAVTRDLITKYHYFHTSFQIWPDQIKGGREGEKTAPLAGSLTQGWLERGQESASSKCPQGPAKEAAARDTNGKGESRGSGLQQSGGRGLREGPQGMKRPLKGGIRMPRTSQFCNSTMLQNFPSSLALSNSRLPMQETRCTGSIPGSGKSPGGGHGNPLQYS